MILGQVPITVGARSPQPVNQTDMMLLNEITIADMYRWAQYVTASDYDVGPILASLPNVSIPVIPYIPDPHTS
jgi:hypothetical protein